jgi:hypothetical protein
MAAVPKGAAAISIFGAFAEKLFLHAPLLAAVRRRHCSLT